jgi:hypothetical protein
MSPILGIYASQVSGKLWPASSYESIASTTAGAGGISSVTFSSISSSYTHLQVRIMVPSSNGSSDNNIALRFNNDSSSVYTLHQLSGDGASAAGGAITGLSFARVGHFSQSSIYPLVLVTDILDANNTNKYKTTRSLFGFDKNGASGALGLVSSLYSGSTSAISQIDVISGNSVTFPQYTSFALYGIKVVA